MIYCLNTICTSAIIDVEGAFLQGCFEGSKELYVESLMVLMHGTRLMLSYA
jgi:hypothetical protein